MVGESIYGKINSFRLYSLYGAYGMGTYWKSSNESWFLFERIDRNMSFVLNLVQNR
jgi:hypothetical protein